MATVTASNSIAYFLWPFSAYTVPEPEDSITFNALDCPLTDGYRASIQTGFDTGTREWKMRFPTLASLEVLSTTMTDINGASVSREECLRSLYVENKVTGTPFVYLNPQNNTYYFVDFADNDLTLARMRIKIYSTRITLRQVRLAGVTLPAP